MVRLRIRPIAVAACLIIQQSAPAHANADDLVADCRKAMRLLDRNKSSRSNFLAAANCINYFHGFYDGYLVGGAGHTICFPTGRYDDMARVFLKWWRLYPEKHHLSTARAVRTALATYYPCRR
jgi:hypothetical protein